MARLLTILSLVLVVILFPPAALALISNNAVPGDTTYPIKRGLEDVIFSIASINPVTKAMFSAARSDRRFQELNGLVIQGKQAGETLDELVEQTQTAANQITQVTDQNQKQKLVEQLSASIEKYDKGLEKISTEPQSSLVAKAAPPTSTQVPLPVVTPTAIPRPTQTPRPTSTPRATVTPRASATPNPTQTSTPTPTFTPTPTPSPVPPPPPPGGGNSPCDRIQNDIQRARCELERIKNGLGAASTQNAHTEDDNDNDSSGRGRDNSRNNGRDRGRNRI